MNVDLERADILNILAALNTAQVRGKESMVTILALIQKLEMLLPQAPPPSTVASRMSASTTTQPEIP